MLIPRFSLRLILLVNIAFAIVFVIAKFAVDGQPWAVGVMACVLSASLLIGVFAIMFVATYAFSFAHRFRRATQLESPFATDKLPPQVIPPRHVDN